MADVHTLQQRHRNMAAIKGKDTKPEMLIRRMVHSMGYRYRLHRKDLPGKPDLVFAGRKKIIEVYGCFWHMHNCSYGSVTPKTNADFWEQKRGATVERDRRNMEKLREMGWKVLVIWECQVKHPENLQTIIRSFLED